MPVCSEHSLFHLICFCITFLLTAGSEKSFFLHDNRKNTDAVSCDITLTHGAIIITARAHACLRLCAQSHLSYLLSCPFVRLQVLQDDLSLRQYLVHLLPHVRLRLWGLSVWNTRWGSKVELSQVDSLFECFLTSQICTCASDCGV